MNRFGVAPIFLQLTSILLKVWKN